MFQEYKKQCFAKITVSCVPTKNMTVSMNMHFQKGPKSSNPSKPSAYSACVLDALFLDFTKAFDKVSHRKLCHKLSCYGVNGDLLRWIKDYLTDHSQCVQLEGISSKSHHVLSGVPQGLVLGPLLFLIYINDVTKSITSTIRLYADDVLIYRVISNAFKTIFLF